jgi:hypothetical protein
MTRSIPVLLAAAALAVALGACGGETGGASRASDLRDAGLKFARCMRENGIDMPDPKTDENGVMIAEGDEGMGLEGGQPSSRFRAAEQKCRKHLENVKPPQLSPEQQKEFRQRALAHAECMRENGVNFPDPKFSDDGGAVVDIGPGSGIDPESPAFKRAQEECRELEGAPAGAATARGGS